ncbi:succinylglutamate desuccinylase/aspartoacylase family protein [Qipengyuania sp. DGS5-3]|uniref:succinylglutamate desuccinylase/aspartoacylase family protein n=1 Tax=Qipengyuania sp. DGS5-3 TaxID=3349632 RepID=UPI0036D2B62D
MPKTTPRPPFILCGHEVPAGTVATIDAPISRLSTSTEVSLPIRVIHGAKPGPTMFVSAAIHGDEILGVEVIRRLLTHVSAKRLCGTLLCIPIVNVFGFVAHQRYLPDRRDLNRCFPGSAKGSLAAQLANVFTTEIIEQCDFGVDLHTAALHRTNLPQIRISADRPRAAELAKVFAPPAIITSSLREGSLRQTAAEHDCDVLLFEAGEALRFDELAIRIGVQGILRVMNHLGMGVRKPAKSAAASVRSVRTSWVRASEGGIFRAIKAAGQFVEDGELLGTISDPFGEENHDITATLSGVIIGRTNLPVVNQGDALMHIAEVVAPDTADDRLNDIAEAVLADTMFDEDEII